MTAYFCIVRALLQVCLLQLLSLSLSRSRSLIQMARKEEGVHWEWPKEIPVIWKKGPMTEKDIATFPGWAELEELD